MAVRPTLFVTLLLHFGCSEVLVIPDDDDDGGEGGGPPAATAVSNVAANGAASSSSSSGAGGAPVCDSDPCPIAVGFEASDLALDETHVYVTSRDDGLVRRVSKSGGPVETITGGGGPAHSLVVMGSWLAWGAETGVWRSDKDNDTSVLLSSVPGGAHAITTDGYSVFFSSNAPSGVIGSVGADGGPTEVLVDPAPLAADLAVQPAAKDWSRLYWVGGHTPGHLQRLYLDGDSAPETLMSGMIRPASLLVMPEGVWVADVEAGTVSRENPSGGGRLFLVSLDGPRDLAVDDELLYVTVTGSGAADGSIVAIGRTRATGTLPIADGLVGPTAIAADEVAIYWIEATPERAVMRLTKR